MAVSTATQVTWEKLPDDFVLPDEPVDNISQPALAAALTESLSIADKIPPNALTTTNYGICATINGKIVVKAPDWAYIPSIRVPQEEVERSYTPRPTGRYSRHCHGVSLRYPRERVFEQAYLSSGEVVLL